MISLDIGGVRDHAEQSDLGGAVVAERLAGDAEAAVDVEATGAAQVPAGYLFDPQVDIADYRGRREPEPELRAVRVAGKDDDVLPCHLLDQAGIVRQDDARTVRREA